MIEPTTQHVRMSRRTCPLFGLPLNREGDKRDHFVLKAGCGLSLGRVHEVVAEHGNQEAEGEKGK
jgi:hypothetical protein